MTDLLINATYNGPPESGNGGYCCGRFAQHFDADPLQALEVTLRKPPPLGVQLNAARVEDGMEIRDPCDLVALVRRTVVEFEPLAAPDPALARQAESRYTGFTDHPFPNCFVCGPELAARKRWPQTLQRGGPVYRGGRVPGPLPCDLGTHHLT